MEIKEVKQTKVFGKEIKTTLKTINEHVKVLPEEILNEMISDSKGNKWMVEEDALKQLDKQLELKRLPGHLAFWFAWFAFFP